MHYPIVALSLSVFWLLLSGHYSPLLLSLGVASVVLVTGLQWRMDRIDNEPGSFRLTIGLFGYGFWLLWCVIKANIDVVRRILDPSMPLQPASFRLDTDLRSPLQITLYANSITLTPGTLTLDVRDDHFVIHCLSRDHIAELQGGEMERRIRGIGW